MPSVLHPLPHVAGCIVKAEWIRVERTYWWGLSSTPTTITIFAICHAGFHLITPPVVGLGSSPSRVLPFSFCRQTITLASLLRQPLGVFHGVIPRHVDYRLPASAPTLIVW